MKILKNALRSLITITSMLSFVGGWIMLVHAPKPAPLIPDAGNSNVPTLEPLRPLNEFDPGTVNFQDQPLFSVRPRQSFASGPFFRTGGS
jgi:hypothetical protein